MSEFKIGDVVRLKSGSPALTVVEVWTDNRTVVVSWMVDGSEHHVAYPSAALEHEEKR